MSKEKEKFGEDVIEEDSSKDSELEEEVEDEEVVIDNERFAEFMQPLGNSRAGVLEMRGGIQQVPSLETDVGFVETPEVKKDSPNGSDSFKYNVGSGEQDDDVKYISSNSEITGMPLNTNIETLGRGPANQMPEVNFAGSRKSDFDSVNQEKYDPGTVGRFDVDKAGKDSVKPFEKKEVKYKASR